MPWRPASESIEVILATNDKDLYQLVGPCVKVYSTAKADLVSPKDAFALLGEAEVTAKWDVPPNLIGDVLAHRPATRSTTFPASALAERPPPALMREHGGLDALLANLDQVKSERNREKLRDGREQILQNRKMVELDCDTELPVANR